MPGFNVHGPAGGPDGKIESHRAHRWVIKALGEPAAQAARTQSKNGPAAPFIYAKSLKLPSLQFDDLLVDGGSSTYVFAKSAKWQPCEVSFYDVDGLYDILKAWREQIWTAGEGMGVADAYKGEPKFALQDGQGEDTFTFTLKGAYPRQVSHGELSYTSSDIKLVTVTFVYDWAEDEKGKALTARPTTVST